VGYGERIAYVMGYEEWTASFFFGPKNPGPEKEENHFKAVKN